MTVATLRRDQLTWLVYLQLGVYGYFLYGFTPSVPLLGAEEGVSRAVAGLHGTALAVGALVAGVLGPVLVRRLGRGAVLRLAVVLLAVGTVVYASVPVLAVTLTGAVLAGTFGSVVVNTSSATLSAMHGPASPTALSEANALAAGMGILGPAVVGACVAVGLGWRQALLLVVPLVAALTWAFRGARAPGRPVHEPDPPRGRLPRRYWTAWGVLVACISVEFATTIWSSQLLRERLGLAPGSATAAVTAVIAGMTVGRLLGGRLARWRSPDQLLLGTVAASVAGFAVVWLADVTWLAVLGLAVLGLGLALQFPLNVARLIELSEGRPDLATARGSLGAGLAIGLGPFVLGALADRVGVRTAFLVVPLLLALAALGVVRSRVDGRGHRAAG